MKIQALLAALPGSVAQGLIWGIMALGVYLTYRVLDYADLTVDGSLASGGAVAVMLLLAGANPYVALACAMLAGMAAGLVTGLLHTVFGIPSILSGILTQLALYSINMRIMGKANQAVSVDKLRLIISMRYIGSAIAVTGVFVCILVALLYWFFGTERGCAIRATGCNECMARAQGIDTGRCKITALVLSNGLVAVSGALYAQYQGSADVKMGQGAIVIGLAAVIIGDALAGRFAHNFAWKLLSAVFGAILYFIVIAFVLQLGLSTTDLKLFSAVTVALFLAVPRLKLQRTRRIQKGDASHA